MTEPEVIDLDICKTQQSILYTETLSLGTSRLQITMKSDHYDFQSHAEIRLWTKDGWQEITRIPGESMKTPKGLRSMPNDAYTYIGHYSEDRDRLLKIAKTVLEVPGA